MCHRIRKWAFVAVMPSCQFRFRLLCIHFIMSVLNLLNMLAIWSLGNVLFLRFRPADTFLLAPSYVRLGPQVRSFTVLNSKKLRGSYTEGTSILRRLEPIYGSEFGLPAIAIAVNKSGVDGGDNGWDGGRRIGVNMEHIVALSMLRKAKMPKAAMLDLHNVFAANCYANSRRSNYRFGDFTRNVTEAVFAVPDSHKGLVARAVLYMWTRYGCDPALSIVGGVRTATEWHVENAPSMLELVHNYVAFKVQNTTNDLISSTPENDMISMLVYGRRGLWGQ